MLFGHGTFANKVAKFNLTGPDMTPQDFAPLLAKLKSKRVVFVNTASASGPFVEALSGPGRVDRRPRRAPAARSTRRSSAGRSSTRSPPRRPTPISDGKVSILEAFDYAKKAVAASYQREGLLPTEHALLDDNGDKEGSMEPGRQAKDGQSAAVLAIGSMRRRPLPADEKMRALYARARSRSSGASSR